MDILILAGIAAFLLFCMVFAIVRKSARTKFRLLTVIISAAGAFVLTLLLKGNLAAMVDGALLPQLDAMYPEVAATVREITGFSPTLTVLAENIACSMLAPILFLVTFIVLSVVTWIVFFVITLLFSIPLRKAKRKPLSAALGGLVQGIIIVVVWLIPVTCYLEMAPVVLDEVAKAGVLSEEESTAILSRENQIIATVDELNATQVVTYSRNFGCGYLYRMLTDIEVSEGTTVHLMSEVDALSDFACDVLLISRNTDIAGYGPEQAQLILDAAVSFGASELLPTVAGEMIFAVTEKWMNGEAFWGMEKPSLGETVDPFFNNLLALLHDDAHSNDNLREDITTAANVLAILANNNTFKHISDTDALLKNLGEGSALHDLIMTLGKNSRMSVLVHDVTDLGMRAVATALKVPGNTQEIYDGFINNTTEFLKTLDTVEEEEKVTAISGKLSEELSRAGVDVDEDIIECFAIVINEDIASFDGEITPDFLIGLFSAYADADTEGGTIDVSYNYSGNFTLFMPLGDSSAKSNNAFVTAFSNLASAVAKIPADDTDRFIRVSAAVESAFGELLADMPEEKAANIRGKLISAFVKAKDVEKTHQNLGSLKSSETVNTSLVTVEDIMKATASAELDITNLEKEAEAFQQMVTKATELIDVVSGSGNTEEGGSSAPSVEEIAPLVGEILNILKDTPTVGEEATGKLFTSIVQSETVRESTGLSATEAKDLADGITGGVGDYEKAMDTVQAGFDIMDAMSGNNVLNAETIEKIIRILDPESANVIKDFFSEERLAGYGVSGEKAQTARELLFVLVDKLALHDQAEREEDIEAVKHLFNLLVIASGQNSDGQDNLFGEEGKIGTAHDVVYTLLDSQLGYEVLIEAMTKDGVIIEERRDAFGIHKNFSDSDENLIIGTVSEYLAEHPTRTLEAQALLALLGIEM